MEVRKRILIVDDDVAHLTATHRILEREGYEVFLHDTPFRTTEIVRRTQPDLVLLDINMPALSGDRLCSLLRSSPSKKDILIVLHSSNDEDSLRLSMHRFGAHGYVCKGDPAALRQRVQDLLQVMSVAG